MLIGTLSGTGSLTGALSTTQPPPPTIYGGPYEVTPSRDTQVLETRSKLATADIVINPIPSNYGLITYSGSILTVS